MRGVARPRAGSPSYENIAVGSPGYVQKASSEGGTAQQPAIGEVVEDRLVSSTWCIMHNTQGGGLSCRSRTPCCIIPKAVMTYMPTQFSHIVSFGLIVMNGNHGQLYNISNCSGLATLSNAYI